MYSEFCFILDKKELFNGINSPPEYGSLLETQTQNYRLGRIHAFLRSYELKADVQDSNITFLLGDAIYKGVLYQDAQQISLNKVDIDSFIEEARGSYLIIKIDTRFQSIRLFNDSLSLYPIYYFENENYAAISNLPIWMESVLSSLGVKVERDGLLAGYDLAIGTGAFGVTGWSKFHLIPFGMSITISQENLELYQFRDLDRFFNKNNNLDDLIEKSAVEIKENIKAIAESSYEYKISDITGGMDSRLVLAAILSQGLEDQFFYNTNGEHPVPDANCALSIMEKFGLTRIRISSNYKTSISDDPVSEFERFIYQSQGSRYIYDRAFEGNCTQNNLLKVGGGLAGGFKSTYSLRLKSKLNKKVSLNDAVSAMFLESKSYLSSSFIEEIRDNLSNTFLNLSKKYSVTYKSVMDFFYVLSRNRYFIGIGEFPNSAIRPKFHALYSESLITAAMIITDEERAAGVLHFKLIKKLSGELLNLPFALQSWSSSIVEITSSNGKIIVPPITNKTERLYGKIKEKEIHLKCFYKEGSSESKSFYQKDMRWQNKQRSLGRNWMWRNFDVIHTAGKLLYSNSQTSILFDWFEKDYAESLFSKSYLKYNRVNELRAVVRLMILLSFQNKNESISKISLEESI